ncbi:MAG TPA: fibronectin type III domain-containing protein, partial [Micromonosporaceae bacterium]
ILRWSQYNDFTKPTGSLVIDGGASSTAQRMVTLSLTATDNVKVAGVRVSNSPAVDLYDDPSGNGGNQWVLRGAEEIDGNATTVRWSLTDLYRGGNNDSGTKTVYAQWRDEQGNWSPIASDTIVANLPPIGDTLPPTGSVTINSGALYTTNTAVSLSMPASDLWTGVALVRISNRPETSGGVLTYGSSREWIATPQSWSLADAGYGGSTANGTRRVYAQFRDGAGNWSPVYSDSIVLDTVAPAAKAPTAAPASGSAVTSSVPTRLTWSATDATSGVSAYQLEQSLDGGAWARISLPTALTTTVVRALAPGHTYRFRVRSSDRAGLWSGWQYGPTFVPGLYQETSTAFQWTGTWTRTAMSGASGGYVRASTQAGATATFTASMRAVGWVAVRGPTRGKATVYVDGVAVASVDLYASTWQLARVVFTRSWASTGTHKVVIRVAGTAGRPRVEVDALVALR